MKLRARRLSVIVFALIGALVLVLANPESYESVFTRAENVDWDASGDSEDKISDEGLGTASDGALLAMDVLERLEVKGRAPKTGYERTKFYDGWPLIDGCSLRQKIIRRELGASAVMDECNVVAGEYDEPYTGEHLVFTERSQISNRVQIDHVVALSDAWQKGAQYMDYETRYAIATDPLNLLAVDGEANKNKSDGDAATWLPLNKKFRCQYVARQVSVKYKYGLWVTMAEKEAILRVLAGCPNELAVGMVE